MGEDYAALIRAERVYVIENDNAVQGLIVLIPEKNAMLLDNLAVSPVWQGMGIGRKLLEFAEQSARKARYRSIRLYTNEAMTENLTLYARIGYSETHRGEEKGLRRVYMTKQLT